MSVFQIPWHPPARTLRQFAALWLLAVSVLAYRTGVAFGPVVGYAVAGLAVLFGVGGLVWPASVRPLFLALTIATMPIGWVVSHALLTVLYYGLFTPIALIFRLVGRDALQRRFEPDRASYWEPKTSPTNPARYLQTF